MFPPIDSKFQSRIATYTKRRNLRIQGCLGGGVQGIVYSTDVSSAIKAFKYRIHYRQEVAVYQRIKERRITSVCGFRVPTPLRRTDKLMVIEMGLVQPPFVLDFASAGVDRPLNEIYVRAITGMGGESERTFRGPLACREASDFGIEITRNLLGGCQVREYCVR